MRGKIEFVTGAVTLLVLGAGPPAVLGQAPLGYVTASGSTITPAFESWYP